MMVRAALIALLACSGLAAPAFADWGGVAVHAGVGTYGYSAGWNTRRKAEDRAMFYCRQFAKQTRGCEVVMVTQHCGGVARGSERSAPRLFVASDRRRQRAGERAVAECRAKLGSSCTLVRTFCANDE